VEVDSATPDDLVAVGQVVAAHGVRGWLKIRPYSASGTVLSSARTWWLTTAGGGSGQAFRVVHCREGGSHLLAELEGVADRDAALALRGRVISVPRAAFPAPDPGEYYWVDLMGCRFYSTSGPEAVLLGEVDDVFDNGAHAVLQVLRGDLTDSGEFRARQGAGGRSLHTLVPFVSAHVSHVDLTSRRIDGDWPADF